MKKNSTYELSTGNVFADIGFTDAIERQAKAELARHINNAIKKKKLTQLKAAALLGIDQPKISALASGKLSGFSLERLFKFLCLLDHYITINVAPKGRIKKDTALVVRYTKTKNPTKTQDSLPHTRQVKAKKK